MGLIDKFLGNQIQKAAANQLAELGLYNQVMFKWLNSGQLITLADNAESYVTNGYLSNGDVYTCVDLILRKLAACPVYVYELTDDKEKSRLTEYKNNKRSTTIQAQVKAKSFEVKALKEVYIKEITDLLEQPNRYQNREEFIVDLAGFFLLSGNSYAYFNGANIKDKKWTEMFVLPAPYMEIISGGMFAPIKEYKLVSDWANENFPVEQVAHIKTFNPQFSVTGSHLYGVSPLKAYLLTLQKNKDTRIELNRMQKNGGVMGFISPESTSGAGAGLTAEQKGDLKQQLVNAKKGKELLDRIFPSSGPLKWTQIGLPSTDLQLLESLQVDRVDIANAYHVPIQLLNNSEASTDNNMGWASKQLIYNAVMPIASKISDMLTKAIAEPYAKRTGKKVIIEIDWTTLPEMQEDMEKVANWVEKSYELTQNEKREIKGFGRLDLPGMDIPLVPSNLVPITDLMNTEDKFTNSFDKDDE